MIVSAEEVHRSLRGTMELLHSRVEGLQAFDMSERGFWHSFGAILLTLPAYIVSLALERLRIGFRPPDTALFGDVWIDVIVGLGHVASFIALPLAMIWLSRPLGLTSRYVPFVIVMNWVSVAAMLVLSFPALLLLLGLAPPGLAALFTVAFFAIVLRLQWFATKVSLGVPGMLSFAIVSLGLVLNIFIDAAMRSVLV